MTPLLVVWLATSGQVIDAPQMDEAERQRTAKVLLDEGLRRYEAKDYERAVESFKAAYSLAPAAGLLFNMAQAYRLWGKGHCVDATRTYRAYLQAGPAAPNREKVEGHLKALEACTREEEPAAKVGQPAPVQLVPEEPALAPAPVPVPVPVVEQKKRPVRWAPLAVLLSGAALLGAGAGLYSWAGSDYSALLVRCTGGMCAPSEWQDSQLKERFGIGMLGVGAVALVAAAVWWLVTPGDDS